MVRPIYQNLIMLRDLLECSIVERTSRFTVVVDIGGAEAVAYLNNTGRLEGYLARGRKGFCIPLERSRARYRLVGVEDNGYAALVDTRLHEKSFEELVARDAIPWLRSCALVRRGYPLHSSRIDYELKCRNRTTLVELKSAIMRFPDNFAGYPDAPTPRGRKHLEELAKFVSGGDRDAYVVFVAGIPNAKGFRLNCYIDKDICKSIENALENGVKFKSINIYLDPYLKSIVFGDLDLPIDFGCCNL